MTKIRNVTKTPAVMEDMAVGRGTVLQKRGTGNKVDLHIVVESVEALTSVDTNVYTRARVYSGASYADYVYLDEEWQSLVDNTALALKIFQSPTAGGLTEIQTRTVNANEVYEVRKASDDSLATIYSDAASPTEILQDGIDNVSGSDGVVEFYIADGDYYVIVNAARSDLTVSNNNTVKNDSGNNLGVVGCAVRYTDLDGLVIISDSGHAEIGVTSVEILDDYKFRVHYGRGYTKVGAVLATIDEALAPYGIVVGGSVGVDFATFEMFAPMRFTARGDGTVTNISPLWGGLVTINSVGTNSIIYNVPKRLNTDVPLVSNVSVSASPLMNLALTSWSAFAIKLTNYAQASKNTYFRVKSDGTNFVVSNSSAGINVTSTVWDAANNELVITHAPVSLGTGNRQVSAGPACISLMPRVSYLTTTTTETRVGFTDISTGLEQTTQTVEMDVVLSMDVATTSTSESALLPTAMYTVDCGNCAVPITALGNISLSNIWLFGAMNK